MLGAMKAIKSLKSKAGIGKKKNNVHSAKKDAFLIDAASRGSLDLVRKFITEDGCSPNLKSPEGKSILQLALEGGHDEVVMYLFLEHKALVVPARGLRVIEDSPDCLHISLFGVDIVLDSSSY